MSHQADDLYAQSIAFGEKDDRLSEAARLMMPVECGRECRKICCHWKQMIAGRQTMPTDNAKMRDDGSCAWMNHARGGQRMLNSSAHARSALCERAQPDKGDGAKRAHRTHPGHAGRGAPAARRARARAELGLCGQDPVLLGKARPALDLERALAAARRTAAFGSGRSACRGAGSANALRPRTGTPPSSDRALAPPPQAAPGRALRATHSRCRSMSARPTPAATQRAITK